MLEMMMGGAKTTTGELLLIDWREGSGASIVYDQVSKIKLTCGSVGNITTDPDLGACYYPKASSIGFIQSAEPAGAPIDMTLPSWELSVELKLTAAAIGRVVMSQAASMSGSGGWYLELAASSSRLFRFWYKDANNTWRSIQSGNTAPTAIKVVIRIVRDGSKLTMYQNGSIAVATTSNVSFNGLALPIAIGCWGDTTTSNPWNDAIGKIKFFVPET